MKERWIVALATIYFVILIGGGLFVGQYFVESLQTQLTDLRPNTSSYYGNYSQPNIIVSIRNITVFHDDQQLYQGDYKPYITTTSLIAQDYRSNTSSSLRISGSLNNTGDGTAYNLVLHVVAMNNEGVAIDTDYSFTGITANMQVGSDFSLPYTGSALTNCTLTPHYLDRVDSLNQTPQNSTFTILP